MDTEAPTPVVIPIHGAINEAPCQECGKWGRLKWSLTRSARTVAYKAISVPENTRKVLMAVSSTALEVTLTHWAEALLGRAPGADEGPLGAPSLDGKSARGSFDGLSEAVHLLSLVAHRSELTVALAEVPSGGLDKTNEHKAAPRLLSGSVLEGRLITGDAMS